MCLAVPGKIVEVQGEDLQRTGIVSFGGIRKEANLAFVPEAKVGDYVLVHAGFAISVVDEAEAAETLEYFRQIGELGELDGVEGGALAEVVADDPEVQRPRVRRIPADPADEDVVAAGGGRCQGIDGVGRVVEHPDARGGRQHEHRGRPEAAALPPVPTRS